MTRPCLSIELVKDHDPNAKYYTAFEMAAHAILIDCLDRRGIKNEFQKVDEDVRKEIIDDWAEIVERCIEGRH